MLTITFYMCYAKEYKYFCIKYEQYTKYKYIRNNTRN